MVMDNKILILLMSCNQPLYASEEQACRDTFLKDAEGAGISYWFYKGVSEEHPEPGLDEETHTLYINVHDGLGGTSKKTVAALAEALKYDTWDYVLKTNVSTWLDVPKIQKAVNKWEGREDKNIYGARFLANDASKKVPFPRGHFTILSRSMVEGIVKWAPILIKSGGMPRTDDTLLCLSTLYHVYKVLQEKYEDKLMEVPSVIAWANEIQDAPEWTDALSVRCKEEKEPTKTPENMRKVHRLKREEKQDRVYRRPMGLVETGYGLMQYKMYEKISTLIDKMRKEKEKNQD